MDFLLLVKGIETEKNAWFIQLIRLIEVLLSTEGLTSIEITVVSKLKITAQALTLAKRAQTDTAMRLLLFHLLRLFLGLAENPTTATPIAATATASPSSPTWISATSVFIIALIAASHSEVEGIAIISTANVPKAKVIVPLGRSEGSH